MGESDSPKDVKPGQQYRRSRRGKNRKFNPLNAAKSMYISGYKAPTPGLENFIYEMGAARCAAQYNNTAKKLTNCIQSNLGSKFRKNSGRNSDSGLFSGIFGSGVAGIIFLGIAFFRTF
jgi:hypothetical protein